MQIKLFLPPFHVLFFSSSLMLLGREKGREGGGEGGIFSLYFSFPGGFWYLLSRSRLYSLTIFTKLNVWYARLYAIPQAQPLFCVILSHRTQQTPQTIADIASSLKICSLIDTAYVKM